jgi:arylsulfatase A-like enzyme/Flp pilus assembly protein TadD
MKEVMSPTGSRASKTVALVAVMVLAAGAGGALCWHFGLTKKFWRSSQPNLLVITLDTTRADRLGCYGYTTARTPALDSLAAAGVLCEQAYTVAPITLPAHASLFTGLYPPETGVRTNGRGRLGDSVETLAQQLARNGFDTAAFIAAFVLDKKFGLDRGFKTYDDEFAPDDPDTSMFLRRRSGDTVVDAALAWLKRKRSRPFFCWVHLYDPHLPYVSHPEIPDDDFRTRPYEAEITYADRQVGRLLDFLRRQRLDEQTLVVVAGDHGEGLGDHGEASHSWMLYDSTLRVPLIWRWPGQLPAGRRVQSPVSLVDVYPTILDELGIRPARAVSGRSLRTALVGADTGRSACYAATDDPFLLNGWSPLRALIADNWKYIRTAKPELYDLANDPREELDLAETNHVQREIMERQMVDFEVRLAPRDEVEVQLSLAERRALAGLGYAAGAPGKPMGTDGKGLPDVKDMLKLNAVVEEARYLVSRRSFETAIQRLGDVVYRSPGHTQATLVLADALIGIAELDKAAAVCLKLLDVNPDARGAHFELAKVFEAYGRDDDAAAEYQLELAVDPLWGEAHYQLAHLALKKDDFERALSHFDAMLDLDGACTIALRERGDLFVEMGRTSEGIADYRRTLKFNPTDAETEHRLGILLSDDDAAEAQQRLQHAVALAPDRAEYRYALGTFFLRRHEYAQAVEHLTRALELSPESQLIADRLHRAQEALHATAHH